MDYKNEVQLRGIVQEMKILPRGNRSMYSFSVLTQRAFMGRDGKAQIKEDLHPCIAWPGRAVSQEKLRNIKKGSVVYIKGHLAYEPDFHIFVESITTSKESPARVGTSVKIK